MSKLTKSYLLQTDGPTLLIEKLRYNDNDIFIKAILYIIVGYTFIYFYQGGRTYWLITWSTNQNSPFIYDYKKWLSYNIGEDYLIVLCPMPVFLILTDPLAK